MTKEWIIRPYMEDTYLRHTKSTESDTLVSHSKLKESDMLCDDTLNNIINNKFSTKLDQYFFQ